MKNLLYKISLYPAILLLLTAFNSCVLDVTVTPEEDKPSNTKLIVTSAPSGAEIFVNGKNTGRKTPDTLKYITDPDLNLRLKLPFFRDSLFVVNIGENEVKSIHIDFLNNPSMLGTIFFTSDPLGAQIFLNDSSFGKTTPFQLKSVLPGTYSVRYKIQNFRDAVFTIYVESNITTTASYKLRDTNTWVDYQTSNSGIKTNFLSCVAVDDNNIKWIGTFDRGIISFDETAFNNYDKTNSPLPNNNILAITVDNSNRKWIGTSGGLAVLNNGSWQIYTSANSDLPNDRINSITIDQNNVIWLGTPSGIVKFDEQTWALFDTVLAGPTILNANDILIGPDNLFWVATDISGVANFREPHFTAMYYDSTSCIPTNRTNHTALYNDEIWITHSLEQGKQSGLSIFTLSTCSNLHIGTSSSVLNNIFIDNRNNKWIASNEGLFRVINRSVFGLYTKSNSYISSNNITDMTMDKNGYYWITTNGGGLNKLKL